MPGGAIGTVTLPIPSDTTIRCVGISNSGWYTQQVQFSTSAGDGPILWQGTGQQDNQYIGSYDIAPNNIVNQTLTVQMAHDPNPGTNMVPSTVVYQNFAQPGLVGYIIGSSDGGSDASWNCMLLVYWAPGH